jgi:hypothetical protein
VALQRSHARLKTLLGAAVLLIGGAATAPPATAATPLVSSNCVGSVCIVIQGSGLQVTDWQTTAWASSAVCTYADFWVSGVLEGQGSRQCVSAGTELESNWKNTSFPNGTVLCNTWPGINGKACATIT